ncbi:MAG TPA: DUF4145 domain-containing protein [Burkholderiales bacterium]|nr:DUF4145 domain-containing protein [Burkholderiales bacterium]
MAEFRKGHFYNWSLGNWPQPQGVTYTCGFCGAFAAPKQSTQGQLHIDGRPQAKVGWMHICPVCTQPTYINGDNTAHPAVRLGSEVAGIPEDGLKQLYSEARDCSAAGAFTACVMVCRKILMNLAVREGAPEGELFASYVTYLADKGFVPPKGKGWVDKIRQKGNEANHQIALMTAADAAEVLKFIEALLRYNFELVA